MASNSALSFSQGITVGLTIYATLQQCIVLRFKKSELRRFALFLLSRIACNALMLTPHVLATGDS